MAKKRSFRIEWAPPCKGSRRQPRWCTDRPHSGTSHDPETLIVWQPISAALATARRLAQPGQRRRADVRLNIAAWRIGTPRHFYGAAPRWRTVRGGWYSRWVNEATAHLASPVDQRLDALAKVAAHPHGHCASTRVRGDVPSHVQDIARYPTERSLPMFRSCRPRASEARAPLKNWAARSRRWLARCSATSRWRPKAVPKRPRARSSRRPPRLRGAPRARSRKWPAR